MSVQPEAPPSRLKIAATILFHSTCAISVTIISKSALTKISLPITLLATQTFVSMALLILIGRPMGWIKIRQPLTLWKTLFPLTVARLIGVLAKTYCLANVHASFYQIARGLLLPFTLLLSYLLLRPRPTYTFTSLSGCALVMCGFGVGMVNDYQKMATSTLGMALGVGSSFTTAVESIVVKKFMSGKTKEVGMWQMIYMTNFMALMIYIPLLWSTPEWNSLQEHLMTADSSELLSSFVKTSIVTGITTFLLTIATFLQISVTSPTTHMIVTAARGVAQSGLAVVILKELVSAGRVLGMACILGGSMIYGVGKEEARKEAKEGYQRVAADDVEKGTIEMKVRDGEVSEKEKA
ncbi:hypothetical protein BJ508DRAFT_243713 [Ascobolus immersus RN42]|uniref:Sugar phosphate transporter domain-containing protein n=1 Tax=Ascobolus immersus RN42 TaxID=1160509 RepID=A0A3N4HLL9_ASCIM|nr:hypothetical protein BJ508DRAFT_243713 [Ascobolus immersus RN42]